MFVLPWCPVNVVFYTAVFVIYVLFTLPNKLRLRMQTALASAVVAVTFANDCVVGEGRSLLSSPASRYLERSDGLRDLEEEEEADDGEQVGDGEDQFADEVRVVLRPERSLEVHVVIVDDVHGRRRPADERRSEQHQHHVVVAIPHVTIVHLSAPRRHAGRLIKPPQECQ